MEVSLDHPKYSMNPVDVCGCGNWRTTNLYNVLNPRGGGEGVFLGILGGGVTTGSPNPDPIYFRPKCNFPHPFSDQTSNTHTRSQTWPLGRSHVIIT